MSLSDLMQQMADAGAPFEAIMLAVRHIESLQTADAERKAKDAARKRAKREEGRASSDCPRTVQGRGADTSLDKGFPDTPSKTQTKSAPLTPQTREKKRGTKIPADWTPPSIADLSEKAREYASRWPAGRYEAEAEAFVAFWLNDGRCRPEWRLTWISRIISVHDRVMRERERPPINGPPATDLDVMIGQVQRKYGQSQAVGAA